MNHLKEAERILAQTAALVPARLNESEMEQVSLLMATAQVHATIGLADAFTDAMGRLVSEAAR